MIAPMDSLSSQSNGKIDFQFNAILYANASVWIKNKFNKNYQKFEYFLQINHYRGYMVSIIFEISENSDNK